MAFDRQQDQFALPCWDAGGGPPVGQRANAALATPVRVVARPADLQRGDAQLAMPVYFVTDPPVTGHRADPAKAIPIWLAAGPPTDESRRDRANPVNAAPVYVPPTPPTSPPVNLVAPRVSAGQGRLFRRPMEYGPIRHRRTITDGSAMALRSAAQRPAPTSLSMPRAAQRSRLSFWRRTSPEAAWPWPAAIPS